MAVRECSGPLGTGAPSETCSSPTHSAAQAAGGTVTTVPSPAACGGRYHGNLYYKADICKLVQEFYQLELRLMEIHRYNSCYSDKEIQKRTEIKTYIIILPTLPHGKDV